MPFDIFLSIQIYLFLILFYIFTYIHARHLLLAPAVYITLYFIYQIPVSFLASTSSAEYLLPALISSIPFSISASDCFFLKRTIRSGFFLSRSFHFRRNSSLEYNLSQTFLPHWTLEYQVDQAPVLPVLSLQAQHITKYIAVLAIDIASFFSSLYFIRLQLHTVRNLLNHFSANDCLYFL